MVVWRPDGTEILFSAGYDIYSVAPTGQLLRAVATDSGSQSGGNAAAFAVSPDGKQLVYATCSFPTPAADPGTTYAFELARRPLARGGWMPQRLTSNLVFDHFPAWSPDGTAIAFLRSQSDLSRARPRSPTELYVMASSGSAEHILRHDEGLLIHHPPAWSPDGTRLAVARHIAAVGPGIFLVDVDAATETLLTESVSAASWSPDGTRLAFARADGDAVGLYTIAADGTDARRVTTIENWWPQGWGTDFPEYGNPDPTKTWIEEVIWSPDGAHILVRANPKSGVVVASVEGRDRTAVELPMRIVGERELIEEFSAASWSPDGIRLALLGVDRRGRLLLITLAPDDKSPRLLTRARDASAVPEPTRRGASVGLSGPAACAAGLVVPDPEAQPGLVADCEALLAFRDTLVGDAALNWREDLDRPLEAWEGVTLSGTPRRVTELDLTNRHLQGKLPSELGGLSNLERLLMWGNRLEGTVPPEFGELHGLRELSLGSNFLTGEIPKELGHLPHLTKLILSGNQLTGPIPSTLGRLTKLESLYLSGNQLSGLIPAELGQLHNLEHLGLSENQLSGQIPAELGQLARLDALDIHDNQLTGCIPHNVKRLLGNAGLRLPLCERGD